MKRAIDWDRYWAFEIAIYTMTHSPETAPILFVLHREHAAKMKREPTFSGAVFVRTMAAPIRPRALSNIQ